MWTSLSDIKYITFSGGGIKGYAHIGAYMVLWYYLKKHVSNTFMFLGASGSSIGALMAFMVCVQLPPTEMIAFFKKFKIQDLLSGLQLNQILSTFGIINNSIIIDMVKYIIQETCNKVDITFKQLYEKTSTELVICAGCVTDGEKKLFSYKNTPDICVWEALVASMSIPFIFPPMNIQDKLYVDGGVVDDLPICAFPLENTIGIQCCYDTVQSIQGFKDYCMRILNMIMISPYSKTQTVKDCLLNNHIVLLNTKNTMAIDLYMTEMTCFELICIGIYNMMHALDIYISHSS